MPRGIIRPLVEAALSRGWTQPLKGFWSLVPDAFGLHAEPPTIIVEVRPWVAQKVAAILCHKTQMGIGHPFDDIEPAEAERWLGTEHFHRTPATAAQPAVLELIGSLTHAL
jgi:LmbE family N-acetylglucosaminyl deacetylase